MKEDGLYDDDDEYMDDPSLVKEDEGSEFEGSLEDRKRKPKGKANRKPKDSSSNKNWDLAFDDDGNDQEEKRQKKAANKEARANKKPRT